MLEHLDCLVLAQEHFVEKEGKQVLILAWENSVEKERRQVLEQVLRHSVEEQRKLALELALGRLGFEVPEQVQERLVEREHSLDLQVLELVLERFAAQ